MWHCRWNVKKAIQNVGRTLNDNLLDSLQCISVPSLTYIPPIQNDELYSKHGVIIQALVCLFSFFPLSAVLFLPWPSVNPNSSFKIKFSCWYLSKAITHLSFAYTNDMVERSEGWKSVRFSLPLICMTFNKFLRVF